MLRELETYHRPGTLEEALQLLRQPHTVALAGGTELLGRNDATIQAVVDLQGLGLDSVQVDGAGVVLGAMVRLQALVEHEALRALYGGALAQAARQSASYTERCAATIGGTVAVAPAWNDLLVLWLALDASVEVRNPQAASIALSDYHAQRARPQGLITAIGLPRAKARVSQQRVARTPADRATVCLAVVLTNGVVRVVVGGVGDMAVRALVVESLLSAQPLTDALIEQAATQIQLSFNPASDHIASGEYRRAMLGVLLQRALLQRALREIVT